tara:strand:+ start:587 stop:1204 length:618 start_codon:yes stop_codon:yes gene_type:complete
MSVPTKQDVDFMSNLRKVMNGEKVELKEPSSPQNNSSHVDISPGVKRADVDAMAKIMKGFSEATTSVAHKVKKTITESTKTEKGVKVGAFSVEKNKEDRYDILDTRSDSVLFEDIQLYATVCCIANHLNEGKAINSSEVMEIIRINELFERHYNSAVQHKHSYQVAKRAVNEGRMDIAQARFSQSKHEASKLKRKISNLYENIIL